MNQELLDYAIKNPLLLTMWFEMTRRARKTDSVVNNLEKGEFYFSRTEYEMFGLQESQQGIVYRVLITLKTLGIIQKVDNKTGSKGGYVYSLLIPLSLDEEIGIDTKIDSRQTADRQQIDRNNIVNKDNNVKQVSPSNKHEERVYQELLEHFNMERKTKMRKVPDKAKANIDYWLEVHSLEEIKEAISCIKHHAWWSEKNISFETLFRKTNSKNDAVNYIQDMLNALDQETRESIEDEKRLVEKAREAGLKI